MPRGTGYPSSRTRSGGKSRTRSAGTSTRTFQPPKRKSKDITRKPGPIPFPNVTKRRVTPAPKRKGIGSISLGRRRSGGRRRVLG